MTRRRESLSGAALVAFAAGLAVLTIAFGGGAGPAAAQGGGTLKLKRIADVDSPVYVTGAPGSKKLLFIVEQPGTVRVMRSGKLLKRPFIDLRDLVRYGGEQGLLSIAFDPKYAKNRRFYVYYVDNGGNISVDGLRRKRGSKTRAAAGSRRNVISIAHPQFENHNGGQLQFGPDRHLYVGLGDGGSAGDPDGNAQNTQQLLGKLLRIDPRKKGGHSSPSDNPFASGGGAPEVYSTGLRNPFRFSFDRQTGDLWIGDVGQNNYEEVDHTSLEGAQGANFGWDLIEGNHGFEGSPSDPPDRYRGPVLEYSHDGGNCSVTGGYVVRDPSLPAINGRYVYADFCGGQLRSMDAGASNPGSTDSALGIDVDSPSSFGEDNQGHLYVTSLQGPVYRFVQK